MNTVKNTCQHNLFLFVALLFLLIFPEKSVAADTFRQWLADFYPKAAEAGISRTTWDTAFSGISSADTVVLERAAFQPEFKTRIWDYLDSRANTVKAAEGKRQWQQHRATLDAVSRRFGVDSAFLLAIWSMESNYGAALQQRSRLHYIPQALATMAWKDKKRRKYATNQLIAALKILQAGDISRSNFTGSWAGAMGHTQFIPTSYLAYAVDMNGDGRRDIWNTIPDALATAANLLQKNRWRSGHPWGFEVITDGGQKILKKYAGQTKTLDRWAALGFHRPDGRPFSFKQDRAELKLPAGTGGPAFLLMKNFFVIKRYNNADAYALGVCLLADIIRDRPGLASRWPRPAGALGFQQKMELQRLMARIGIYSGSIDGAIGSGSRAAISNFQRQQGLKVTGKADQTLLEQLKRAVNSTQGGE